jgi:hypothetical protein
MTKPETTTVLPERTSGSRDNAILVALGGRRGATGTRRLAVVVVRATAVVGTVVAVVSVEGVGTRVVVGAGGSPGVVVAVGVLLVGVVGTGSLLAAVPATVTAKLPAVLPKLFCATKRKTNRSAAGARLGPNVMKALKLLVQLFGFLDHVMWLVCVTISFNWHVLPFLRLAKTTTLPPGDGSWSGTAVMTTILGRWCAAAVAAVMLPSGTPTSSAGMANHFTTDARMRSSTSSSRRQKQKRTNVSRGGEGLPDALAGRPGAQARRDKVTRVLHISAGGSHGRKATGYPSLVQARVWSAGRAAGLCSGSTLSSAAPGADAQLGVGAPQVMTHCLGRQEQGLCDLGVG